jgi:hypothetical protein
MRTFSIRIMMGAIIAVAISLTALRNANEIWAGMIMLVVVAAIGIAVLGAIFLQGHKQAWWVGFGLFGGGYLAFAVGPWFINTFQPILSTTHVLKAIQPLIIRTASKDEVDLKQWRAKRDELEARLQEAESLARSGGDPAVIAGRRAIYKLYQQIEAIKDAANYEEFQQIGHCLFAVLSGLLGATVAIWFYGRRDRVASDGIR